LLTKVFRAKYPLAVTKAVEASSPGPNLQGYDIGCAFEGTLRRAKVFEKIRKDPCSHTLPVLHGYGHNRLCQLGYQSIYHKGSGLSDFEQCERFFSACNSVAGLTRHATPFHRHQYLEMHFQQSAQDRIKNLGKFIYDHYRQALDIINHSLPKLKQASDARGYTDETYWGWTQEERDYLQRLKHEPPEDTLHCLYAESLERLWEAE
jgi:hypothetical protein